MFIISSSYVKTIDDADLVAEHRAFVQANIQAGHFLVAGARDPRTGGVVVARGKDESRLRELMSGDPFVREGIVTDYEYMAFAPSMAADPDLLGT